uniref:Uncharacterized protein n=1 Tax=Oryza glumipatula TaxID=40148 RepID=A0A0D9ZY82_9ORYZ
MDIGSHLPSVGAGKRTAEKRANGDAEEMGPAGVDDGRGGPYHQSQGRCQGHSRMNHGGQDYQTRKEEFPAAHLTFSHLSSEVGAGASGSTGRSLPGATGPRSLEAEDFLAAGLTTSRLGLAVVVAAASGANGRSVLLGFFGGGASTLPCEPSCLRTCRPIRALGFCGGGKGRGGLEEEDTTPFLFWGDFGDEDEPACRGNRGKPPGPPEEGDGGGEEPEAAARERGADKRDRRRHQSCEKRGGVKREREREERGDGDDDRIRQRSDRTAPPPPSPLLEAPVLATEEHADNVVVVVAAVGHRAETGGGERPSRPSPPPSWTPPHEERGEQRREREEKVAAAAAGKGEEGGGTGAREIEREREGEDDDSAERRE